MRGLSRSVDNLIVISLSVRFPLQEERDFFSKERSAQMRRLGRLALQLSELSASLWTVKAHLDTAKVFSSRASIGHLGVAPKD